MWIDESSDPNRFMTIEERCKYVGAITESALDEAVIDAESASRVYDATCDAEDLKTLLEDLVSGLHLDDVVARLRGISRFVRGENKDEIEDIANGLEATIAHVESGIGAIENKLDELKRSLQP